MTTAHIGQPASRVDGRAKVTGAAKYAAEYAAPGLAYGWVVSSAVAKGRVRRIDASAALRLSGVLQVFTHENAPSLAWFDRSYRDQVAPKGSPFRPLHDDQVRFSGQPVALVVADTLEQARHAASLVRVEYDAEPHRTDLDAERENAYETTRPGLDPVPPPRGDVEAALANVARRFAAEYRAPAEHHNPMEPFATTAVYEPDGTLTVYDKTQGVKNNQEYLTKVFGLSKDQVRVVSPYVGGAFGSGLRPQYQLFLAVLAARELKRSVRVVLTRQQMFTFGHRPITVQKVALAAGADGALLGVLHEAVNATSTFEDYTETIVHWSGLLYRCDNVKLSQKVAKLDLHTPIDMRAPGAAWGVYALECAMDELAYEVGMDPLALRLKNYAERDQNADKPFSSKRLRDCYQAAADRFGWARRRPGPRSMRDGDLLVGWGMATGAWEAQQQKASAKATLTPDGKLTVGSATADIGTGTYTVMTQIAAEMLGLPLADVTFRLGDTALPESPVEGGSWTAATIGAAVKAACDGVREKLFALARDLDGSPLAGLSLDDVTFADRALRATRDPARSVTLTEAMRRGGANSVEAEATSKPAASQNKYSRYAHSAVFAEVKVDADLGVLHVTRVVSAVAAGRILNPKTARSQVMGGIVWGIGMALEEESLLDQRFGRFMNHNLAEYHVPVNADVRDIDVIFVEEQDDVVNPLGVKGIGEIGLVGVAAAIANAAYHATGVRVRELPIHLDRLMTPWGHGREGERWPR